ncbi:MAG: hypothetical protein HY000_17270 [Planctomycetes bacterium]|nr:hypothetical protein [Planctomycetota bacterium]
MAIPVYVKYPVTALPSLRPGEMRYVLAREGLYFERSTAMYVTTTRTDAPLLDLEQHQERCLLTCDPMPRSMIRVMLAFFRAAYAMHEGEAALILLYNPKARRFRWHCPDQTVDVRYSFGRWRADDMIHYENPLELPAGYIPFGDAHSHGNWMARPSGIDRQDETYKDGLHIIVGNICRRPEYHIDFVMDCRRFEVPPEIILEDVCCEPFGGPPPSWLKRIQMKPHGQRWSNSGPNCGSQSYHEAGYGGELGAGQRRNYDNGRNDKGRSRR